MNMRKGLSLYTLFTTCIYTLVFNCSDDNNSNKGNDVDLEFDEKIVSTDWLNSNLNTNNIIVIDVRSADSYSKGHIPNSINLPFTVPISVWTSMKGDLLVELPEISQLSTSLGEKGITKDSKVVLVTNLPSPDDPYALASPTRVAVTLFYVGLKDVAILDGGYDKWVNEGKKVTTNETVTTAASFNAIANNNLFVDIEYLKNNMNNVTIIDARDAEVYSGDITEPFASKAGHIQGAVSLPAPYLWNSDGTYKTNAQIQILSNEVIGKDKDKEIIIYCGVGGYASTVWFALTQILNYQNVKIYDGSAQEWVQDNDMVTTSE